MPDPECDDVRTASDPASRPIGDPRIAAAMRLAEARLDAPPTTGALAAAVGLSQFHFLRLFLSRTGETVSDYIRRIRLDAAALQLRGSSEPIVSIALAVGYGSQAAFTRAFTKRFGRSPASYRRQAAAGERASALDPSHLRNVAVRRVAPVACLGRRYLGLRPGPAGSWPDFLHHLPPGLAAGPNRLLRIVHDDPRITPADQIRVDCCVVGATPAGEVPGLVGRGFQAIEIQAGIYATIPGALGEPGGGLSSYDLLDGWLARQGRYRLRGGSGRLEFHAAPGASHDGAASEILVPVVATGTGPA